MKIDQYIFTDKDGNRVICSIRWWKKHIICKHPEVTDWLTYIKVTVQDPYQVYQDQVNLNKNILYRPFILPAPFSTQYLRIAIKYKQEKSGKRTGFMLTVFPCSKIKKGDILIWQKPL